MRRALAFVTLVTLALVVSACGDNPPSSSGDLASRASSLGSQASEGLGSLTGSPTTPTANPPTDRPDQSTTPVVPSTATATVTQTETSPVTRTATATVITPSPTPSANAASTPASATTTGSTPVWPWLLLAAAGIVVVVLIVAMGSRSRRRGEWDAALAATTQDATWLNDSFTPNLLSQSDAASMQPVWASGTARFDDADRTLMQAAQNAPDDGRRALVESLRGALSGLRQSLQHIVDLAGSGAPGDEQRQALAAVQQAQTRLRESTNAVTPPSS